MATFPAPSVAVCLAELASSQKVTSLLAPPTTAAALKMEQIPHRFSAAQPARRFLPPLPRSTKSDEILVADAESALNPQGPLRDPYSGCHTSIGSRPRFVPRSKIIVRTTTVSRDPKRGFLSRWMTRALHTAAAAESSSMHSESASSSIWHWPTNLY